MGNIQNSVNAGLGSIGAAVAFGSHVADQEMHRKAEVADLQQKMVMTGTAIKEDTLEAAKNIAAHEEEGVTKQDIDMLDPTKNPDGINGVRDKVEELRTGALADNRNVRVDKAGEEYRAAEKDLKQYEKDKLLSEYENGANLTPEQYQRAMAKEKAMARMDKAKTELDYANEAKRELNQRIVASAKLKYDHDSAVARLQQIATKKELYGPRSKWIKIRDNDGGNE